MPPRKDPSLETDEEKLRRIHARRRFKAIVWLVMANRFWLIDDQEVKITDNVRRNVQMIIRRKEKKSLLTLQEKAILCKPAEARTEEEKTHLYRVIGGLKCFRRYPSAVKRELAGYTYFKYFPSGRVIIRQDDPPYALYFILFGEVAVTKTVRDPVLDEDVQLLVGTLVPGNMFGEISLLHGVYRTATITTSTACEFLVLLKEDFDVVLKEQVEGSWNDIKSGLKLFTYFDSWDEMNVRECCILSKINDYQPEQTILGDGCGHVNSAYFILKGKCQVIEHLLVQVEEAKLGKKKYKLYEEDAQVGHDTITLCSKGHVDGDAFNLSSEFNSQDTSKYGSLFKTNRSFKEDSTCPKDKRKFRRKGTVQKTNRSLSSKTTDTSAGTTGNTGRNKMPRSVSQYTRLPVVEVHFMQCCFLNELAVFGIGENFVNRRVVAVTPVRCLLIPRYWLWQRNDDYVWSKVQQYLNNHIPNTKDLFEYFLHEKKWKRYKRNLVESIINEKNIVNFNSIHDVPYSIRIAEDTDFM